MRITAPIAILGILLLQSVPILSFGQKCNYTISPATHHNWIDVTAQRITDSIGIGADSVILRTSKKIAAACEPFKGSQHKITRTFIKFDLAFDSKNSCDWEKALLNLRFTGNTLDSHKTTSGPNDFVISRIIEPWGDDTLRWKNPPLIGRYRMPLAFGFDAIKVSGTTVGNEDYQVDIVKFINFWREYPDSNFGIEIRLANETGTRSLNFASSEFDSPLGRPSISGEIKSCSRNSAYAGKDVEICIGQSYQLSANYLEFFEWSTSAPIDNKFIANPTTTPTAVGSFTYKLTAVLGTCTTSDEMVIKVNPYPVISVSANQQICYGDTAAISVAGATNYVWSPNSYITDRNSANPKVFPLTTTRYDVLADNGNACKTLDSVRVVVRPLTKTDAGTDVKICEGSSIQLFATGGKTYTWTGNTSSLSATNIHNPTASPVVTTTYYLTASNGYCPVEDSVKVTVIPAFTVNAGPDQSICLGDTTYLNGEPGFFFYEWTPAGLFNKTNIADPFILGLQTTQTVKLRVEDENQCFAEDELTITVNMPPFVYIGSDSFVCVGDNIDILLDSISGNEPFKYNWSPGFAITTDTKARDINIEGIKDTLVTYELRVTDANGCEMTDDILITTLPTLAIETYGDTTICYGSAVEIGVKGGRFFKWAGEDIIGSDIKRTAIVQPDKPTEYQVEASSGERCGNTIGFVNVNVIQLPKAYAHLADSKRENDTAMVCKGRYAELEAEGAEWYIWNTGDTAESISYRVLVDDYYLTVFGISKGCPGPIDSILIKIDQTDTCYSKVFVPNAFSPNNDGKNDVFAIKPFLIEQYKLSIFNRWGNLLYYTEDPYAWWDGTFNGQLVQEGVYYYVIEAFGRDEESRKYHGTVQVLY